MDQTRYLLKIQQILNVGDNGNINKEMIAKVLDAYRMSRYKPESLCWQCFDQNNSEGGWYCKSCKDIFICENCLECMAEDDFKSKCPKCNIHEIEPCCGWEDYE